MRSSRIRYIHLDLFNDYIKSTQSLLWNIVVLHSCIPISKAEVVRNMADSSLQMTTPCGISFQAEEPELLPRSPVLYTMIPSIIRNRLFPLRKSVSEYTLRSQTQSSIIHRRSESLQPSSSSANMDLAVLSQMGPKFAQHGSFTQSTL